MGAGTGTAYQHDVRWQPDHTLTIFDNGAIPKVHSQSRVIRERIDWSPRKVTLIGRDVRTPSLLSGSQGNDQVLSNGDSFVGWGEEPYFTEFGPTGQILFEAAPALTRSSPTAPFASPGAPRRLHPRWWRSRRRAATTTVYASWNGATGVSAWRVLGGATPATLTHDRHGREHRLRDGNRRR